MEEQDVQLTNDNKVVSTYSNPNSANAGKPVNQGEVRCAPNCGDYPDKEAAFSPTSGQSGGAFITRVALNGDAPMRQGHLALKSSLQIHWRKFLPVICCGMGRQTKSRNIHRGNGSLTVLPFFAALRPKTSVPSKKRGAKR